MWIELTDFSSYYYIKHQKLSLEHTRKCMGWRNCRKSEFMFASFHIAGFLVLYFPANIRSPSYTFSLLLGIILESQQAKSEVKTFRPGQWAFFFSFLHKSMKHFCFFCHQYHKTQFCFSF